MSIRICGKFQTEKDTHAIKYNTYENPINVDISKDITYLNRLYKRERKEEWFQRQNNWNENKMKLNEYVGNMIMQK